MISRISRAGLLLAALATGACGGVGAEAAPAPAGGQASGQTVWQLSPVGMLAAGSYDGVATVAEVQRHGDLGLGAADQLNGEMALVDGRFYQFLAGGRAVLAADSMRMPFGEVTAWQGGRDVPVRPGLQYDATGGTFKNAIDSLLPTPNAFYALRLEGT